MNKYFQFIIVFDCIALVIPVFILYSFISWIWFFFSLSLIHSLTCIHMSFLSTLCARILDRSSFSGFWWILHLVCTCTHCNYVLYLKSVLIFKVFDICTQSREFYEEKVHYNDVDDKKCLDGFTGDTLFFTNKDHFFS